MYTGRKRYTSSKFEIPYVVVGLCIAALFFVSINVILKDSPHYLVPFLMSTNGATFFLFGFDKLLAASQKERIPERVLYVFCLLGGSIGGIVGMQILRHKTQKTSFQTIMGGILIIQIIVLVLILKLF